MINDADLDMFFANGLDMILNSIQYPLKIRGIVGPASIVVIHDFLISIISNLFSIRVFGAPAKGHQHESKACGND